MGIALHWFSPTSGDSRNVVPGVGGHGRAASIEYLTQIARAADNLGSDAVLTPTGTWCEDAYAVGEGVLPRVVTAVNGEGRSERQPDPWGVRHQAVDTEAVARQ